MSDREWTNALLIVGVVLFLALELLRVAL